MTGPQIHPAALLRPSGVTLQCCAPSWPWFGMGGPVGRLCHRSGACSLACSQFMDSMQLDPETVDNLDMYSHIPPILMEKCAALSVRPDTVKNLVQSMQGKDTGTRDVWAGPGGRRAAP